MKKFNDFSEEELVRLPTKLLQEFRHDLFLKNVDNIKWIETFRKMIKENSVNANFINEILEDRRSNNEKS